MTLDLTDEQKRTYAGLWLLKKMDLKPEDGGMVLPTFLPAELSPLEEIVAELEVAGWIAPHRRKERYELTKAGLAHIGATIDEAEALIDEFDDAEPEEMVAELRARNLDPFRARFLWGWYTGELDDLVLFQQRRGVSPVQSLWAYYLMDDDLYELLAQDVPSDT